MLRATDNILSEDEVGPSVRHNRTGHLPGSDIAFFIHTPKDPASAVFMNIQCRAAYLRRHGHQARIMAPEDFRWLRHIGSRWYPLLYGWAVVGYIIRHRDEIGLTIFHSHAGWVFHLLRKCLPCLDHIRTVTQFHGLEPLFFQQLSIEERKLTLRFRIMQVLVSNALIRASCRRSDQVHCQNSIEYDYLRSRRWVSSDRLFQYSNGVPAELFAPREYHQPVRRVLFLGQWIERKGIRALVQAFAIACKAFPGLELWCVGTRRDAATVLEDVPEYLRHVVHVVPTLPHEQVMQHLFKADIFVFPSLSEGFGTAVVEAMATGLPIISTRAGVAIDVLVDHVNALLVPVNDAAALAEAIERLAGDGELQMRLGLSAQLSAQAFEWERVGEAFRNLLLTVRPLSTRR